MYDIIHMFIYRIVIYWQDGNICNNKMHMFSGYINTPTQSIFMSSGVKKNASVCWNQEHIIVSQHRKNRLPLSCAFETRAWIVDFYINSK